MTWKKYIYYVVIGILIGIILDLIGFSLKAQVCPLPQVGFSEWGPSGTGVSWGGFVPGSATSLSRRNVSGLSVDANSATWMSALGGGAPVAVTPDVAYIQYQQTNSYVGEQVHYIHGNTARRTVMRQNPAWGKTSTIGGSMTMGSNVLNVSINNNFGFDVLQSPVELPYFMGAQPYNSVSKSDVGRSISVAGAIVLAGITAVNSPTQVVLNQTATATVSNVQVTVGARESYGGDPGTVPMPPAPRLQQWYDMQCTPISGYYCQGLPNPPESMGIQQPRPYGYFLQNYPSVGDQHLGPVIDIDNCIEYDYYGCFADGSNSSCALYKAYNLKAGDHQIPYGQTGGFGISGIPYMFYAMRPDEWTNGLIPHFLGISAYNGYFNVGLTDAATAGQEPGTYSSTHVPFGGVFRLKGTYNSSSWDSGGVCNTLITQLKNYGLVLVDGGGFGDVFGLNIAEYNPGTPTTSTCQYKAFNNLIINSTNFDVVQTGSIYCMPGGTGCPAGGIPTGSNPTISSFTATPSTLSVAQINSGSTVTLHWTVSGATDIDGNDTHMRNISWGPNQTSVCVPPNNTHPANPCSFGPGWVLGPENGESVIVIPPNTVGGGTYHYLLYLQNSFGTTTQDLAFVVTP
jgi:hypothetical protein